MAVTVTNSAISALNTVAAVTSNAATADADGTAEVFTITPTKAGIKGLLVIGGTGAAADAAIGVSIAAGDLWAGKAVTASVAKNTVKAIQIDTGYVMQDDGTIAVTLTPAAGDKLKSDHAAYVQYFELLY